MWEVAYRKPRLALIKPGENPVECRPCWVRYPPLTGIHLGYCIQAQGTVYYIIQEGTVYLETFASFKNLSFVWILLHVPY